MSKITIDPTLCHKCGTCVSICPQTVFNLSSGAVVPALQHESLCFSCGQCVAMCPYGAVKHMDFPTGSVRPASGELMPSADQVLELMKTRRSVRVFKDRPVEGKMIEKILEGARHAPSMHNTQSTEFIVIQNRDVLDRISELTLHYLTGTASQLRNPLIRAILLTAARDEISGALRLLKDFDRISDDHKHQKDTVLFRAPYLILFHGNKSTSFSNVNANLALHNAALVAHAFGLGAFYAGYVVSACKRDRRIPELVSLPSGHQIFGALAVGYPGLNYGKCIEKKPAKTKII